MAAVFSVRERVRWTPERRADWADDGFAEVLDFNLSKPMFGPDHAAGPAYEIRLEGRHQWTLWVSPSELAKVEG